MVHSEQGPVHFHKDKNGLPYIDLDHSDKNAATLLIQTVRGTLKASPRRMSYVPWRQGVRRG